VKKIVIYLKIVTNIAGGKLERTPSSVQEVVRVLLQNKRDF
jgi:hypothetical protein